MPGIDFYTASFAEDHREEIDAVVTLVLAFVTAELVDRALSKRGSA